VIGTVAAQPTCVSGSTDPVPVTVNYRSTDATQVSISGSGGVLASSNNPSGSFSVQYQCGGPATQTFTLTATGPGGDQTFGVPVKATVTTPSPAPTDGGTGATNGTNN
jgi:hypothetical protein